LLPLAKNIRRYFSVKIIVFVLIAIALSVLTGASFFTYYYKEVVIDCDGSQFSVKTLKSTVREVLEQRKIKVSEFDYVSLPLDSKLTKGETTTVYIKFAVPIKVEVDGKEFEIKTSKKTVGEALKDEPVRLDSDDRIEGAYLGDRVAQGLSVKVFRVRQEMVSQNEVVSCDVVRRANDHMDRGKEKVVSEGRDGVKEKVFNVIYENGVEVQRILVSESIVSEPQRKVVEYGTIGSYVTSRGASLKYKKVIDMKATAYTASFKDTGKSPGHPEFGITYTGIKAKRGIVAVDPKVIPLGTRLYVEGVGDVPDYGYALAADIGSAIKGNKIDLYMDGQDVVDRWGVKKVKVYILYE